MEILTPEQLAQLTGYRRRRYQINWLRRNGIEPFISATGEITVLDCVLEEAQKRRSGFELQQVMRRGLRPSKPRGPSR